MPSQVKNSSPQSAFPLPDLYTKQGIIYYGIFLWTFGVNFPGCIPSQVLVALQPSEWERMRSWKVLDLIQTLYSNN